MVGTATLGAPMLENTDTAWVDVFVLRDERRRGVGSALLEAVEEEVRALGRQALLADAYAPVGAEGPGSLFAARHGFRVELEDGIKVVDLVATRVGWKAMAEQVAPFHADYRLVTTWAPVPDELMDGFCALNTAFNAEAPSGESDVENEQWDAARVRDREAKASKAGRHDLLTFALDAAGDVVGLTELVINETQPQHAEQSGTLVLPAHRGHRLGMAVKLANHLALVERFPQVEWMVTGTADVNAAMNAINDALGYRVVERCLELRKELG
jgi:GNAT superfamily N-acetyltransferase